MPNTAESEGGNISGAKDPAPPARLPGQDNERGFLSPFSHDTLRTRRASSAELQLPWTCPVTHSREKFYTVCSDYALLNQARPILTPRDVPQSSHDSSTPLSQSNPITISQAAEIHTPSVDACDLEETLSSNYKPILAWEIDTTDFDAVLTRKARTGKIH